MPEGFFPQRSATLSDKMFFVAWYVLSTFLLKTVDLVIDYTQSQLNPHFWIPTILTPYTSKLYIRLRKPLTRPSQGERACIRCSEHIVFEILDERP